MKSVTPAGSCSIPGLVADGYKLPSLCAKQASTGPGAWRVRLAVCERKEQAWARLEGTLPWLCGCEQSTQLQRTGPELGLPHVLTSNPLDHRDTWLQRLSARFWAVWRKTTYPSSEPNLQMQISIERRGCFPNRPSNPCPEAWIWRWSCFNLEGFRGHFRRRLPYVYHAQGSVLLTDTCYLAIIKPKCSFLSTWCLFHPSSLLLWGHFLLLIFSQFSWFTQTAQVFPHLLWGPSRLFLDPCLITNQLVPQVTVLSHEVTFQMHL